MSKADVFTGGGDAMAPDDGSPGLEFWADFKLSLDANTKALQEYTNYRKEQMRLGVQPRVITFAQQSTANGTTTDLLDFGCPQPGRKWVVRAWGTYLTSFAAGAAVVTSLYVGQRIAGAAAGVLPVGMLKWQNPQGSGIPYFKDFSSDIVTVKANEHVFTGLTGKGNTDVIASFVTIQDMPEFAALPIVNA